MNFYRLCLLLESAHGEEAALQQDIVNLLSKANLIYADWLLENQRSRIEIDTWRNINHDQNKSHSKPFFYCIVSQHPGNIIEEFTCYFDELVLRLRHNKWQRSRPYNTLVTADVLHTNHENYDPSHHSFLEIACNYQKFHKPSWWKILELLYEASNVTI